MEAFSVFLRLPCALSNAKHVFQAGSFCSQLLEEDAAERSFEQTFSLYYSTVSLHPVVLGL